VSRYNDYYSANALIWSGTDTVAVEVVGPGFDASDLSRGDSVPHETVEFSIWQTPSRYPNRRQISPAGYVESVHDRWRKIASELGSDDDLAGRTSGELTDTGYALLAANESSYTPIPDKLLRHLHRSLLRVAVEFPAIGLPGPPLVLSCSFVGATQRPVYWDVVSPTTKYQLP
jgi:hypothetical protein